MRGRSHRSARRRGAGARSALARGAGGDRAGAGDRATSRCWRRASSAAVAGALLLLAGSARLRPHRRRAAAAPAPPAAPARARRPPPARRADRGAGHRARPRADAVRAAGGDPDQPRRQHRAQRARSARPPCSRSTCRATREAEFRRTVRGIAPHAEIAHRADAARRDPRLRRDIRVADLKTLPEGAWALRGERGLTYSATLARGQHADRGQWWPADYAGAPLVSVDERLAQALDLKIGDPLTVSLLGVERTARDRLLPPDRLGHAGLQLRAGVLAQRARRCAAQPRRDDRAAARAREARCCARCSRAFPVGLGDRGRRRAARRCATSSAQVGAAIAAAAGVAVLAGIAVLLGAIAAARAARTYDTVILRMLGATRGQVLGGAGDRICCCSARSRAGRRGAGARRGVVCRGRSSSVSPGCPIRWWWRRRWSPGWA